MMMMMILGICGLGDDTAVKTVLAQTDLSDLVTMSLCGRDPSEAVSPALHREPHTAGNAQTCRNLDTRFPARHL